MFTVLEPKKEAMKEDKWNWAFEAVGHDRSDIISF